MTTIDTLLLLGAAHLTPVGVLLGLLLLVTGGRALTERLSGPARRAGGRTDRSRAGRRP